MSEASRTSDFSRARETAHLFATALRKATGGGPLSGELERLFVVGG